MLGPATTTMTTIARMGEGTLRLVSRSSVLIQTFNIIVRGLIVAAAIDEFLNGSDGSDGNYLIL